MDTTQIVELDAEGCVLGATGRKLKVNPEWKNPTGKKTVYHNHHLLHCQHKNKLKYHR